MKTDARIRFNPVTKEIEIEGSEEFVKAYFNKIQKMISGAPSKTVREPKAVKAAPKKKAEKKTKAVKAIPAIKEPKTAKPRPAKKAKKTAKKKPRAKRITKIDTIVGLIKGSADGISTAQLKEKTGLAESQIWNIVNSATKAGKVKKIKRGVYGAA
jgi:outer membrane biosynthesis protein TonB